MKIGKIELSKEKIIVIVIAAICVIALGVYLVFYVPLMRQLKTQYLEYRSIENEVLECRNIIESAGRAYGERVLMTEEDTAAAIDELTRHGKLQGINFVSISPKEIKKEEGTQYKILPIGMEIESTYEQLGTFLGSLDELEKGLIKVEKFGIAPDKEDTSRLTTDLVVDIYLSGR